MNNVSLVGRLTKDVELRYTTKKVKAVCSFVLAVDRNVRKGTGDKTTDFIPVVVWGRTAEFASKFFAKGHRVALQGSIHTRIWEDGQKSKHYVTEVIADKVFFADAKYRELDEDDCQESIICNDGMAEESGDAVTEENIDELTEEASSEEAIITI